MYTDNNAMEKLLRIYRHDFLNVLQVVGGLAQLNKTDRLLAYIRKASEEVQQFGRLIACGEPRLALTLYESLLQDLPGGYLLHVTGSVSQQQTERLAAVQNVLLALQKQISSLGEGTVSVGLKGAGSPLLTVRLLFDTIPPDFWQPVLQAARENGLYIEIDEKQGELSLYLDNPGTRREE